MGPCEDRQCDFFVSYTKADEAWAEWIAWVVEEMGFQAMVQAWDFLPGHHWAQKMDAGVKSCERTIAVLSPDYQKSVYGAAEWQTAWVQDAQGIRRKLLPVRVRDYKVSGLLATVVYIDLFGTDETTACRLLEEMLNEASADRAKPGGPPPFPGGQQSRQPPRFPGAAHRDQDEAVDGGATADNVTSLSDFRRRGNEDSANDLKEDHDRAEEQILAAVLVAELAPDLRGRRGGEQVRGDYPRQVRQAAQVVRSPACCAGMRGPGGDESPDVVTEG
jgi:hypothetical protein